MVAKLNLKYLLLLLMIPVVGIGGPNIQHWDTANSSRVYFVQATGLPLLDLRLVFDAGSARDGKQFGVAALTAGLLDTGTKQWDADVIADRLDSIGAVLGIGVSRDSASISLRCLTKGKIMISALETLRDIISFPSFRKTDFERERQRVLVGLRHREESPASIASIAYYQALYGEHPYAHPSDGNVQTVEQLSRDDLDLFYRRYYLANNLTVVLVGDISNQKARSIVDNLLSDLPRGSTVTPLPAVKVPAENTVQRKSFPSRQTHIFSGMPILSRKDPDYIPLYVGNHILGGSGLVSRISDEIREKRGLSYSAYSYFSPLAKQGPFTMGLQTRNDQADEALSVLNETVGDFIENGPSADELDAAKKNITGGFVLRYDTNKKLADYVAMIGFYQLPLDYLDTFPGKVNAVTREDILDAYHRRVQPAHFQTILVGGDVSK